MQNIIQEKNKKVSCLSNTSKFITKKVILRTHKLIGDLSDIWSCSVDYSYRLLFEFAKNPKSDLDSILLLNIGSHDEVYQKRSRFWIKVKGDLDLVIWMNGISLMPKMKSEGIFVRISRFRVNFRLMGQLYCLMFSLLGKSMIKLTIDLETSAEVLGTTPDSFLDWLKREHLHSLIYFNDMPQISIFTLARILDTTPRELVNFLEETEIEDRLDLQDALDAIAESERLGEKPVPWESMVGELV